MSDETLDRIAEWCEEEPDIDLTDEEIVMDGDPPLRISINAEGDRLLLSHVHRTEVVSEEFAAAALRLLTQRGSMVRGSVEAAEEGINTTVEYPVYRDGISRQTFLLAIRSVAATVDALASATGAEEDGKAPEPPLPLRPDTVEATEEIEPPAAPVAATWAPTHTVPRGGMNAWAKPDPDQAPVTNLEARVELRLDETRGAWAHVTGSNGWTGWVDGRRLVAIDGAAPAVAADRGEGMGFAIIRAGGLTVRLLPLLGGIAIIVSALLPWESFGQINFDVKPFDLLLAVLWGEGTPTHPELWVALLVIGIGSVAFAFVPRIPRWVFLPIGVLGTACAVLFFIQLGRLASWDLGDVFEILGIGVWFAFAGGIFTGVGGTTS